jgi:hypothetical protein
MRFFRRGGNSQNALAGIFLLLLLAVFAGPNTLPRLLSRSIPFVDEGVPCDWLPTASGQSQHQSLIGRAAEDPISLSVSSSPIPSAEGGTLDISITVINASLGAVPILFNPDQVLVGDNSTSGLGIIFDPPNNLSTGFTRQDAVSYPESDIRLLGPRQRCVHKLQFAANQLDASLGTGNATVKAYYRINSAGQIIETGAGVNPVYTDQGLKVRDGYIESAPVFIPLPVQTGS